MKNAITTFILIALIITVTGCAATKPKHSVSDLQKIMKSLRQQQATPTFNPQQSIAINIKSDTVGLTDLLKKQLIAQGATIVDDPSQAQAVISGRLEFIGKPEDAPSNSELKRVRKVAGASALGSTFASLAMKTASPASLISGGIGLLTSTVSKAMEPNRLQGIVSLRITQSGLSWALKIDRTVEANKDQAKEVLAESLFEEAMDNIQG